MVYPLQHELDQRLAIKSFVLGVVADGQARTYPAAVVANQKVINDRLGDTPLVAFCEDDYMQVFDRRIVGATLNFEKADQGSGFTDMESGSEWTPTGKCTSGKHQGTQLAAIPHYNKIFWFVWSDYFPNCDIYGDTGNGADVEASAA